MNRNGVCVCVYACIYIYIYIYLDPLKPLKRSVRIWDTGSEIENRVLANQGFG